MIAGLCALALNPRLATGARAEILRDDRLSGADDSGITVDHRPFPGSAVPEILAQITIAAPAKRVHAVLADYNAFADFVPNLVRSRIIRARRETFWVYQRLRLPWPFATRRYVIRAEHRVNVPAPGAYRIRWRLDAVATARLFLESGIAPHSFSGSWELRPVRDRRSTRVVYVVHLDLGGEVPKWLVSFATGHFVPRVLVAVRRASLLRGAAPAPFTTDPPSKCTGGGCR